MRLCVKFNEWMRRHERKMDKKYNWAENAIYIGTGWGRERTDSNGNSFLLCVVLLSQGTALVSMFPCLIAIYYYWYTTIPHKHRNISNSLWFRMLRWNSFKKEICQPIQFNSCVAWPHSWNVCVCIYAIFHCYECCETTASYAWVGWLCRAYLIFGLFPSNWHFHNGSAFYGSIFMLSLSDFGRVPSLAKDYLLPIYGSEDRSKYAFFSLYPSIWYTLPHPILCLSGSSFRGRFISRLLWITVFWLAFLAIFKSGIESKMKNNSNEKKCEQEI